MSLSVAASLSAAEKRDYEEVFCVCQLNLAFFRVAHKVAFVRAGRVNSPFLRDSRLPITLTCPGQPCLAASETSASQIRVNPARFVNCQARNYNTTFADHATNAALFPLRRATLESRPAYALTSLPVLQTALPTPASRSCGNRPWIRHNTASFRPAPPTALHLRCGLCCEGANYSTENFGASWL